jgi:hypothetical protein
VIRHETRFGTALWLIVACSGCGLSREGALDIGASSAGAGGSATASGTGASDGGDGSGAGASGSGGAASGTGGGTGAAGGSAGAEVCMDGRDNDADGMVDCADTDCQSGHECVPEVPGGWEGYQRLATLAHPAASTTPCADGSMPTAFVHAPGGPAVCEACSCGGVTGASCSLPTLAWWVNSSSCNGSPTNVFNPGDTSCHALPGSYTCFGGCANDARSSIGSPAALVGAASCPPAGGAATIPPAWGFDDHVCPVAAQTGGGCDAGSVCIEKASAPYDGPACISQPGDVKCPGEWPTRIDAYQSGTDSRGCDACSCDPAGVACAGDKFTVYDDNFCSMAGAAPVDLVGNSCPSMQNHVDNDSGSYRATAATLTGDCTAGGGQPIGEIVPTGAVSFCCR